MVVGISLLGESKEEEPTSVLNMESPSGNSKYYIKNLAIFGEKKCFSLSGDY